MTDIILGLQGEIPNGSEKGVPYVAGKYGIYQIKSSLWIRFSLASVKCY